MMIGTKYVTNDDRNGIAMALVAPAVACVDLKNDVIFEMI